MDNPWANAWDESISKENSNLAHSTSSTWKDPSENEADIALPSWSAGPAVLWNEPSDDAPSLWESSAQNSTINPAPTSSLSPKGVRWVSSYDTMSAHFGSIASEDTETEAEGEDDGAAEETGNENKAENDVPGLEDDDQLPNVSEAPLANHASEETSGIADPWTPSQSSFPSTSIDTVLAASSSDVPASAPASPDAFEFGTFETGPDSPTAGGVGDTWSSSINKLPAADSEWGSVWVPEVQSEKEAEEEEVLDEWEQAKREKERMDRFVPPEFLASILRAFEEISDDLLILPSSAMTDNSSSTSPERTGANSDRKEVVEETEKKVKAEMKMGSSKDNMAQQYSSRSKNDETESEDSTWKEPAHPEDLLNHWKDGMDVVEGLSTLCTTIIPPLPPLASLPALTSQSNSQSHSFVSKRSAEAIRLTRSTTIASSGPLGMYLKTKGSIEWEVAVKARPTKTTEEEREESVPVGWRIVPKEEEKKVEAPEMKRKGTGILSSFFGRRASTPPVDGKENKDASPRPSLASPRVSVDSASNRSEGRAESSSPQNTLPPNPVSAPTPSTTTVASPFAAASTPSNYGDGGSPDLFQDAPVTAPAPAPSAVSRFLNRFSRSRPSHARQGSNSSLALSTNDLEFLEDIVPSARDTQDHDLQSGSELMGLQTMISSAPLPAPLMPPPRAPPQVRPPRNPTDDLIGGSDSFQASQPSTSFNVKPSSQILTPSPALPSQIQTTITQQSSSFHSRPSTPSTFVSPLSRSSSPGSDMLAVADASGRISSHSTGTNAQGGTGFNMSRANSTLSSATTSIAAMKRPTPAAIMSSSPNVSSQVSLSSFSFLPPPPSIRSPTSGGNTAPSLLIDDEPTKATPIPAIPPVPAIASSSNAAPLNDFDDDEFSDFHSADVNDSVSQPPFSAQLFALSSAQPLFSAGSAAFTEGSEISARPDAAFGQPDSLNTSVSSVTSAHSTNTMLRPLSGEMDLFQDLHDEFNTTASPAPHATLRTPSPPALPAKSPAKLTARNAAGPGNASFGAEPSGMTRRDTVGKKTPGGSGLGGRVAPGRLNLPPISASAYSRNWGQGPSSAVSSNDAVDSAAPLGPSPSEPVLSNPTSSSGSPKTHQRRVSKEAHQRTRSLVEEGIARSGMWPSPASKTHSAGRYGSTTPAYGAFGFGTAPPLSPLPPILSPPPESGQSQERDLLGGLGGRGEDDEDEVPLASLASGAGSVSNPSVFAKQQQSSLPFVPGVNGRNDTLPPIPLPGPSASVRETRQTPMLMEFDAFASGSDFGVPSSSSVKSTPFRTSTSLANTKTTGALSAQDLSFFEGL
ncbi:hypothetical protein GYMLUDRAFT_42592 [Collybiopsis luxurians FD-317 M1]|uniref:Uncharacterized protein n=1 Tax=Collybiopsis luxurians FD-317 M1 TaxID=944289 RepID=A0A0D0C058_9AGAR|nr:hypothetical protein GYMLUDRAFT_42592 [Collybiopsis luxurians FD-317 M1]